MDDRLVWGIRFMRGLSASIELTAAFLLLHMTDVKAMIRLNSVLGLVGPFIFITVSAFGIAASLNHIQPGRLALVVLGVVLVVLGTR